MRDGDVFSENIKQHVQETAIIILPRVHKPPNFHSYTVTFIEKANTIYPGYYTVFAPSSMIIKKISYCFVKAYFIRATYNNALSL